MFVCTHILTVRTQVFLFKANYGTAVDQMILFHENAQVKKFNALYQDVLKLNAKIEKIKKKNVAALEGELKE